MKLKLQCISIMGALFFGSAGHAAPIASSIEVLYRDALGVIADPASGIRGGFEQNIFSFFGGPAMPKTITDPITGSSMGGTMWTDGSTLPPSAAHVYGAASVAVTDTNPDAGKGVHAYMELRGRTTLLSGATAVLEQGGASIVADLLVGLAPGGIFSAILNWDGPFAGTMPQLKLQDLGGPPGGPLGGTMQAQYFGDGSYDRTLLPLALGNQDGMDWYRYAINAPLLDTTPFNNFDGCLGVYGPGWCVEQGDVADSFMRMAIGVDNGGVYGFTASSLALLGLPAQWLLSGGPPEPIVQPPDVAGPQLIFAVPNQVPEPSAWGLLALGLLAMGLSRLRQPKAA